MSKTCGHTRQYKAGCKECQDVGRRQRKAQRLRDIGRTRGISYRQDKVPVAPYQDIIWEARGFGISINEMSRITGSSGQTLRRILSLDRDTGMVVKGTGDKIRKTLIEAMDDDLQRVYLDGQRVDPKRTRQIILSLNAQGWTAQHLRYIIENNLKMSSTSIASANRSNIKYVTKLTEDKAEWLARQLGEARGPSNRVATIMKQRGRFPLRHYDIHGNLIISTLSAEQRQILESVQSTHD